MLRIGIVWARLHRKSWEGRRFRQNRIWFEKKKNCKCNLLVRIKACHHKKSHQCNHRWLHNKLIIRCLFFLFGLLLCYFFPSLSHFYINISILVSQLVSTYSRRSSTHLAKYFSSWPVSYSHRGNGKLKEKKHFTLHENIFPNHFSPPSLS